MNPCRYGIGCVTRTGHHHVHTTTTTDTESHHERSSESRRRATRVFGDPPKTSHIPSPRTGALQLERRVPQVVQRRVSCPPSTAIIANAEHPLTRREIASRTHFSNCAITGALCVLLHHDFLTQSTPEPADGEPVLSLTPRGRKEFERLWSWPQFLLAFIPQSSPAALADLIAVLTRQWHLISSKGTMPSWKICVNCTYFTAFRQPTDTTTPHHCAVVLGLGDSDYIRKPSTTLIPSLK
jgi:hypothetical protein